MTVRTANIVSAIVPLGNGVSNLYTCPAGKTVLIKCVTMAPGVDGGTVCALYVLQGNDQLPALRKLVQRTDSLCLLTFIVLEPGWVLQAQQNSGSAYTVMVHGAILDGVA